jgi:hypothetical protein
VGQLASAGRQGGDTVAKEYANEATAELMTRFTYAESYRKQFDDKATDNYKLYIGYRKEITKDDPAYGRSNLHIPRAYEIADTWRSRVFKAFAGPSRPYFDFAAMPTSMDATLQTVMENAEKAPKASALVDSQLEKNSWPVKLYEFLTNVLIFPIAWMSVSWRYEVGKTRKRVRVPMVMTDEAGQPIIDPNTMQPMMVIDPATGQPATQLVEQDVDSVLYDDNELNIPAWEDMWWDPRGKDIDTCRFIFQREYLTQEQIKSTLELLKKANTGGTFHSFDWDTLAKASSDIEDGQNTRLSEVDVSPDPGGDSWSEPYASKGYLHEVLHYWEDDRHALIVNRNACIYDGPNPYWRHRKKPFVAASFEPLPGQMAGMSVLDFLRDLQHELNTNRNQRIDNVSLVLNRMWFRIGSPDVRDDQIVSKPGNIIDIDSQGQLVPVETPDVTASSYNEESIIKQDMESSVGTPSIVRGVDNDGSQTAREAMLKNSGAAIRFDTKITLMEHLGFKRMCMLMDMNNQQLISSNRLVKDVNGGESWQEVEPDEVMGEWDYRPAGASTDPSVNKEVRREQIKDMIVTIKQLQLPFFKLYDLSKEWAGTYDLHNPQKFMFSEEEVMQRMQAEAMAEQQGMMKAKAEQQAQQQQQAAQGAQQAPPVAA